MRASPHSPPDAAAGSPTPESGEQRSRPWVPIRSLSARHRKRIATHLRSLDERSRYLRFGFPASDAQIDRYVAGIDFEQDEVFGIFNRRLELVALAHLAHGQGGELRGRGAASEFGVSVLPRARRRGFGRRLFQHAMLHARNRGVRSLFVHALSENTAMLQLARSAGAIVERDGGDAEAWLTLPRGSLASHLDALIGEQAAELDYRWKRQSHRPEVDRAGSAAGASAPERASAEEPAEGGPEQPGRRS
jgi:ribosomal protein S18 acetylase RimI-like enzyme